jgi:hypothetical protein
VNKKNLTDGSGTWFDADKAESLGHTHEENQGNQRDTTIYHMPKGKFIKEMVVLDTDHNQSRECVEIKQEEAVSFLMDNGIEIPEWLGHLEGDEL